MGKLWSKIRRKKESTLLVLLYVDRFLCLLDVLLSNQEMFYAVKTTALYRKKSIVVLIKSK